MGLAANQVGVQKRLFVYDIGDGPGVIVNPELSGHKGEWEYTEGCLSVPDLAWPIVRFAEVRVDGLDLDGNPVSIEGDDLMARMLQHEVDHLDGRLLLSHLDRRAVQGGHEGAAPAGHGPVRSRAGRVGPPPCASPISAPPTSRSARCAPWWRPGTRSSWSSPSPTRSGAGAVPSWPAR